MKLLKDHEKIEKDIRLNGQIQLKRKLSNVSQKCNCIFWHPLSLLRRFRMTLGRFGNRNALSTQVANTWVRFAREPYLHGIYYTLTE